MTRLYDLETAEGVIEAYQLPPFRFLGVDYPAGSWILCDLRSGRRQAVTNPEFRRLEAQYGEAMVDEKKEAIPDRARRAYRHRPG